MEEPVKDQSSAPVSKGKESSKLRFPLRSATKSKEEKSLVTELSNPSAPKRGRPLSAVSKSVAVLDLSGKEKSGKPPRRNSIAAKSAVSPLPRPLGSITPISERATRFTNRESRNGTPNSNVSRSSSQKKFSVLSSASYWLSQIKLSESVAKHNISLGFFKLALEAKCEPLQRMRDELKAYARRHNLAELGEPAKQLFKSYNISENLEPQVSETISQVFEEGTRSSDEDVHSSSSVTGARKLKPKSLDIDATSAKASSGVAKLAKKGAKFSTRKSVNATSASENVGHSISKKSQKTTKKESEIDKSKMQKQGKCVATEKGPNDTSVPELLQEDKENMDSPQMEEVGVIEL